MSLPSPRSRQIIDYKLAASYVPALILWCKVIAYTCIIPVYWMGGNWQIPCTGLFLIVLYYDHLYLNRCHLVDTTSVAIDVVGAALISMVRDIEGCGYCVFTLGIWRVCGGIHLVAPFTCARVPTMVPHIVTVVALLAELTLASSPIRPTLVSAFAHTALYGVLVLVDVYLLESRRIRQTDRLYMFRYGVVLLAPWKVACVSALLLLVLQTLCISRLSKADNDET